MEMLSYALYSFYYLLIPVGIAALLWLVIRIIFGNNNRYLRRVWTILICMSYLVTGFVVFVHTRNLVHAGWSYWIGLLIPYFVGLKVLLLTGRHHAYWGTVIYLVILAGIIWFDPIMRYATGLGRDYLPSHWTLNDSNDWLTRWLLGITVLGCACGLAVIGSKRASER